MKNLKLLSVLLIICIIIACSSDDSPEGSEDTLQFYKRTEVHKDGIVIFDKTVDYNSEKKIRSITTNDYGYRTQIITVNYTGSSISEITEEDHFDSPNPDREVSYNVTVENNKIKLTSGEHVLEIHHSGGYVTSTKEYYVTTPNNFAEQVFTRDSNLNLTSNTTGDGSTFTYTDFDSGKKIDPFGSVTEYFYADYFKIFELKVTNSNPLTATYSNGGVTDTYNEYLEYNDLGYVIRTTHQPNSTTYFTQHQYISL